MFPHGETVTVLTARDYTATDSFDPYADEWADSWDDPIRTDVPGVAVEPRPSSEPQQDARNAITSGYTLYLPTGTQIAATDRIEVRGKVHEVLGEPAAWRSPFTGWTPGVVVQVELREG